MFGIKRGAGVQLYQDSLPMPITDEVSASVTYIGYCQKLGDATDKPLWMIVRITISGTVTTPEYARGNAKFEHIWDDRASLEYSR